jgi:hypothetical protein
MSHRQIKLRIYPDGRVEAEIDGIPGSGCTKFIPLVEQLVGGETIESQRTATYFVDETLGAQTTQTEATPLKGSL